jgi:hypothetical protein
MRKRSAVFLVALAASSVMAREARAAPLTRQARSCVAWHESIQRTLWWSEALRIHAPARRAGVKEEADRLQPRCIRDIGPASVDRYVLLMKLLVDDDAESFDQP